MCKRLFMFSDRVSGFFDLLSKAEYTILGEKFDVEFFSKKIIELLNKYQDNGKKIFVIGNGGSAAIASHVVIDLQNVMKLPAQTIAESAVTTCISNDYGYEYVYSRPLNLLAQEGDLLIAISSSGKSLNILNACKVMKQKKGVIVALSGFNSDNPLREFGDLSIWTGSQDYGLVETAHAFILHAWVDLAKEQLKSLSLNQKEVVYL